MIRSADFLDPLARYSYPEDEEVQEKALNTLVDAFAAEMKAKLLQKMREGYRGWDDHGLSTKLGLGLRNHAQRAIVEEDPEQLVDVANLAAMLWNMERD